MAMEVEKTLEPDVLLVAHGPTAAAALAQGASAVAAAAGGGGGGGGGGAVYMERRLVTLILINFASIMERADEALLPAVYDQVCNLCFMRSYVCFPSSAIPMLSIFSFLCPFSVSLIA
jgi:hypothetical protein